LEKDGQDSR